MAATPEGKVKKKVKDYLKSIGAWYYMPVSNGMGRVGCPDILVCYEGRFLAFETKAAGKIKNVTANQKREIAEIKRANGLAHVVDCVEQVQVIMEQVNDEIIKARTRNESQVQQAPVSTEETRSQQQSETPSPARWTCNER
jgi:hypothetical protein